MRLARGATRAEALRELAEMQARDGLQSVPTILQWWNEITRTVVRSINGRVLRQKLGLKS